MPVVMSEIIRKLQAPSPSPQAATFAQQAAHAAQAPCATQAPSDGFDAAGNASSAPLPWAVANLGEPVLPDADRSAPRTPLPVAAQAVYDGMAYRQRHLPLAMALLTKLAAARMQAAGFAKARYGQSEAAAALQAAELELEKAQAGRRAMWTQAATGVAEKACALGGPKADLTGKVLGQALSMIDQTIGPQRQIADARWQERYIALRERMAKQIEDLHGNDYSKAMQQLERSMETSRQMATSNTDTLRSISNNL